MTKLETTPFDAAKYIRTPEAVMELLNDAFESGHAGYMAKALGTAARSEGMTKIAAKSGINRQALCMALSQSDIVRDLVEQMALAHNIMADDQSILSALATS